MSVPNCRLESKFHYAILL